MGDSDLPGLFVCAGQGAGAGDPAEQYDPAGHGAAGVPGVQ